MLLPVRAQPGAKSSGVRGEQDGALKVSVTQIAEKGKANKALVAVLSDALDVLASFRPGNGLLRQGSDAGRRPTRQDRRRKRP